MTKPQRSQAGFTLVEALVAMVVLVFGLIAVTNLLLVAASSNTVANHGTATAAEATETMERIKALPMATMRSGGSLTITSSPAPCLEPGSTCVAGGNFSLQRTIPGVGMIQTRWTISQPQPTSDILYITVRSESLAPLARSRSRAEFTSFRTCSVTNCPCSAPGGCPY